jgi:glucose dehydrogenase
MSPNSNVPLKTRVALGGKATALSRSDSWPNDEAMMHGGGMTWQPVTYDLELNLINLATGNRQVITPTGLFYVNASRAFSLYHIYDPSDKL